MSTDERHGKSKDEIARAYASPPLWYDVRGFFILTFAYNSTLTHQLRFFSRNMGDAHLEVACGTGTLLDLVLRWRRWQRLRIGTIVGVDYAESMLDGARWRFRHTPGVSLRHADAAALPFPDETFDTANIANALHCFPDVDGALREVCRVLKPGGLLAANSLLYPRGVWPFRQIARWIDDWGMRKGILYTPYTADEMLARVREAGFEVLESSVSGNTLDMVARRPSR